VSYYWFLEVNPVDWEVTNTLIELGATHVSTNMLGDKHIRRFVKNISDEEATLLILQFGDRISIWKVSSQEEEGLRSRGFIKS
jgi:hypothetical protein